MKGSSCDLPIGREMFPVLSPSAGALGTIGSRTEVLGTVLGPGVDSVFLDVVDAGWGKRAKLGVTLRVGSSDAQTASMLALPGMAVDLQLGEEEAWSGGNRGQNGSGWLGSFMGGRSAGSQQMGWGSEYVPCHLSWDPLTIRLTHPGTEQGSAMPQPNGVSGGLQVPWHSHFVLQTPPSPGDSPPCSSRTKGLSHSHAMGPASVCG